MEYGDGFFDEDVHSSSTQDHFDEVLAMTSIFGCDYNVNEAPAGEYSSDRKNDDKNKAMSSYEVFVLFATPNEQGKSNVLSTDCLRKWIETRRNGVKNPAHSFRKALIAHLCGRDGRKPFSEEMENLVLEELSTRQSWPCLEEDASLKLLGKGFRGMAYHESIKHEMKKEMPKKRINEEDIPRFPVSAAYVPVYMADEFYSPTMKKLRLDPLDELLANKLPEIFYENMNGEEQKFHFGLSEGGESTSDVASTGSILETFEDVTAEEVNKVMEVRDLTRCIYDEYLEEINSESDVYIEKLPRDICGDVRLLRILRACKGDIQKTVQEVSCFLAWRKKNGVERIRLEIEHENLSAEELKQKLTIRARHCFLPFYSQDENGDILELYKLQPSQDQYTAYMVEYLRAHTILCEFRSSLLDRLSHVKRRVVKIKVILDLGVINDTEYWWNTLRLWAWYLTRFSQLYFRWNAGMISRLHLFGNGSMFQRISGYLLPRLVHRFFDGEVNLLLTQEEQEKVLMDELGDVEHRPQSFGGNDSKEMCDSLRKQKVFSVGAR